MGIDYQAVIKGYYYEDPRRPYTLFFRTKDFVDPLCPPIF